MRKYLNSACAVGLLALAVLLPAPAAAQSRAGDLKLFSLEDLVALEVTSVSKREEKLTEAPSAIFVVTAEDIRRSGATTIPEVLRMVPGLQVAHIDANKWAVSSRGFNGRFANKMLVLVDGRSVYTPLFSGVYWDAQDTVMGDIERIEVIRGPGATLWGANAVNGVINIITRGAHDTRGASVSTTGGNDERAVFEGRYGMAVGDAASARVYMKYMDRRPGLATGGSTAGDRLEQVRGGVRLDWDASPDDRVTVQGEVYDGTAGLAYGRGAGLFPLFTPDVPADTPFSGGHVLGRWKRALSSRSDVTLQGYYDRTHRSDLLLAEMRDTADVDVQVHTRPARRHNVVGGVAYRTTWDTLHEQHRTVNFRAASRQDGLFSAFGQDEITIFRERVRVTGGTKVEHHPYTGWQWQPGGRGVVMLSDRQTLWAAVSRAVRTPARFERDVEVEMTPRPGPGGLPIVASLVGSEAFEAETLRAHEVGYRIQPMPSLSIDIAAFRNLYSRLRSSEPLAPTVRVTDDGPQMYLPLAFGNGMEGRTQGIEATASISPRPAWRINASYTHLNVDLWFPQEHPLRLDDLRSSDDSPRHQARLHSGFAVGQRIEADAAVAYVGSLPDSATAAYVRVDGRIGWRLAPNVMLAVGARNLRNHTDVEFPSALGEIPTAARRAVFANARWTF